MRSRDNILDLFSTFAFLEGDRVRQWIPDPRLRRNMKQHLEINTTTGSPDPSASEQIWSLYWYKIWATLPAPTAASTPPQPNTSKPNSAQLHLTAYLQESCYWTAKKSALRFAQLEYTLADYFQIASGETVRVLKGFNPSFGSNLKSYAPIVLTNILKDHLRQRRLIDVCSDLSLLRKVSQKRVTEVLQNAGVTPNEAAEYTFAWTCFKTLCVPTQTPDSRTAKIGSPPEAGDWNGIAQLYNSKRQAQIGPSTLSLSPEQLEMRLTKLTRWIREYLYPNVDSLNKIKPGQEQGERQDDLSDPLASSPLEVAIAAETQREHEERRSQMHDQLTTALARLDETAQKILRLFYQDNLSQQELADRMQMSQPTVSRRLKKAEASLLAAVLKNVPATMNNQPEPSELKPISIALREWLDSYYRREASQSLSR
jgi:RNA polymerase sigma factor (sigma-70 family)